MSQVAQRGFLLIAGPCLIESWDVAAKVAETVAQIASTHGLKPVFKVSYRKANRTSGTSVRGIGDQEALEILNRVRSEIGIAVTTDVHETVEVKPAAEFCEIIQIPAFLCRQTELVEAAARSGRAVNIKKGQFLAPRDMGPVAEKARAAGAREIYLTERGTSFGYHDLVVDFRSLQIMKGFDLPVIFDATHSVQRPGAGKGESGGDRDFIPLLIRAALAAGVDGLFLETHPDPANAASDRMTQWPLAQLGSLFQDLAQRGLLAT
jgi:2-dehydro-3-deoxyphosphooctonate aldolase (KDO 8-P synthase)